MSAINRLIPIFPLPNCVVFPSVMQGLHIFEKRYRAMMADELERQSKPMLAIALLQKGYEAQYCTHYAPIHPVLCLGEIVKSCLLPDGRYNLVLLGQQRVIIEKEFYDRSYRRGILAELDTKHTLCSDASSPCCCQFMEQLAQLSPSLGEAGEQLFTTHSHLESVIDQLAYHALPSTHLPIKQQILSEISLPRRAEILLGALQEVFKNQGTANLEFLWPPECNLN